MFRINTSGYYDRMRQSYYCDFSDGISDREFEHIVAKAVRSFKRLDDWSVSGTVIKGIVRSQSGASDWVFFLDFNDFGHITGNCWVESENCQSNIPIYFAENVQSLLQPYLPKKRQSDRKSSHKPKPKPERYVSHSSSGNGKNIFALILIFALIFGGLYGWYKYDEYQKRITIGISSSELIGLDYERAEELLKNNGFTYVVTEPLRDLETYEKSRKNMVSAVDIHGDESFDADDMYPYDNRIVLTYHSIKEEYIPVSAKDVKNYNYHEVNDMLKEAGFVNVRFVPDNDLIIGFINKEDMVESLSVDGDDNYSSGRMFPSDTEIVITYHAF